MELYKNKIKNTPHIKINQNQNQSIRFNRVKPSLLLCCKAIVMGWQLPRGNRYGVGFKILNQAQNKKAL